MIWRCLSAVFFFGSAAGCGTKVNPGGSCPAPLAPITYTAQVEPLMLDYCVSCHSVSSGNRQGAPTDVNLDSYQGTLDNADVADQDILSGRMPQNDDSQSTEVLTQDQRCIFDGWVSGGFLQ